MKHIKKFESTDYILYKLSYHSDDYVYLKLKDSAILYCKIVFVNSKLTLPRKWDYMVEAYNHNQNKFENIYIDEESIKRKMTVEEIQTFLDCKTAINYNL